MGEKNAPRLSSSCTRLFPLPTSSNLPVPKMDALPRQHTHQPCTQYFPTHDTRECVPCGVSRTPPLFNLDLSPHFGFQLVPNIARASRTCLELSTRTSPNECEFFPPLLPPTPFDGLEKREHTRDFEKDERSCMRMERRW